jgi:hypothetical protein|tara:strand:- start:500 stop:664 length:165 start_codon:yes stop_codon:yes gene_type:complete
MEEKYSINEILNAVNEINEVKVNTQIKVKKKVDNNNDIPTNTLKLIEQAEKSKG